MEILKRVVSNKLRMVYYLIVYNVLLAAGRAGMI